MLSQEAKNKSELEKLKKNHQKYEEALKQVTTSREELEFEKQQKYVQLTDLKKKLTEKFERKQADLCEREKGVRR